MTRESWTDERLDDFSKHVDQRFDWVEGQVRELRSEFVEFRAEMNGRFEKMDARLDSMQRTMIQGAIAMTAAILAGFAAMCAVIALVA